VKVLVDANILLDVLLPRQPFDRAAAAIWSLADSKSLNAIVSALTLSNIYYISRKALGHDRAMQAIEAITRTFAIASVDARTVSDALASNMPDFEDALQIFCAVHAGATHIVTRDLKDFSASPLPVLTPAQLLASLTPKTS
jgi:predicted nucleic acid-binding protein